MRQPKKHTLLWLVMGLVFSINVLLVVSGGLSGKTLITDPDGIPEAADAVMSSLHTGDWEGLSRLAAGTPDLNPATGRKDSAEQHIYEVYLQSLEWTCQDGFIVRDASVIQTVSVTCLDIGKAANMMHEILKGKDISDPGLRAEILEAAAEQVLNSEIPVMQQNLTLTFLREKKQWRVLPDSAFLALLSGFTSQ